jgi:antitoxin CptB
MTAETETRRKRLRLRAWRRGTREMDLILGGFADARLGALDAAGLDAFEALMDENDQDLYAWVAGQAEPPSAHASMLAEIAVHAQATHDERGDSATR